MILSQLNIGDYFTKAEYARKERPVKYEVMEVLKDGRIKCRAIGQKYSPVLNSSIEVVEIDKPPFKRGIANRLTTDERSRIAELKKILPKKEVARITGRSLATVYYADRPISNMFDYRTNKNWLV